MNWSVEYIDEFIQDKEAQQNATSKEWKLINHSVCVLFANDAETKNKYFQVLNRLHKEAKIKKRIDKLPPLIPQPKGLPRDVIYALVAQLEKDIINNSIAIRVINSRAKEVWEDEKISEAEKRNLLCRLDKIHAIQYKREHPGDINTIIPYLRKFKKPKFENSGRRGSPQVTIGGPKKYNRFY